MQPEYLIGLLMVIIGVSTFAICMEINDVKQLLKEIIKILKEKK